MLCKTRVISSESGKEKFEELHATVIWRSKGPGEVVKESKYFVAYASVAKLHASSTAQATYGSSGKTSKDPIRHVKEQGFQASAACPRYGCRSKRDVHLVLASE